MATTFHLSTALVSGQAQNSSYPKRRSISSIPDFLTATSKDHCVGTFTNDKRSKENFIKADVIFMDIDNDDKIRPEDWNDEKDWMTPQRFSLLFASVEHIITPSKSNNKQKGNRSARPKFHIYFPLDHSLDTAKGYEEHIQYLVKLFVRQNGIPFFDTNATDCARFFYGNTGMQSTPTWNEGKSILDWIAEHERFDEIKSQLETPATRSVSKGSGSTGSGSMNTLFKSGWKYKDIIRQLDVEAFYGDDFHSNVEQELEGSWKVRCTSGKHDDKKASLQVDRETFSWKCWAGCGQGNVFDFISLRDNRDVASVIQEYCDVLGVANRTNGLIYGEVLEPNEEILSPEEKAVERINEKHALIVQGGKARIMKWHYLKQHTETGGVIKYPELDFMNAQDFRILHLNDTISVGDGSKNQDVGTIWLSHPDRNEYDGIEFDPTNNEVPKKGEPWNMWCDWRTKETGFERFIDKKKYKAIKDRTEAMNGCRKYLNHIQDNICGKFVGKERPKAVQYLMYWMADALVNPTKRRPAIALRGGQGAGKGQFVGKFAEFFGYHYRHITQSNRLTDNFNWHLKDNLLLFSDEAFFAGDKAQASMMKGLVTERTRMIEKKYMDAQEVQNFTRLILASNDEWIVPNDWDDRRWFVIDVDDKQKQNTIYFGEMIKEWSEGGREAFMWLLLEVIAKEPDFQHFDFEKEKIKTKAQIEQMIYSNVAYSWYEDVLERGYFRYKDDDRNTQTIEIKHDEVNEYTWQKEFIYEDYRNYCANSGNKYPGQINHLSAKISKLKISFDTSKRDTTKARSTVWRFSSLDDLRLEWETITGIPKWSGAELLTEATSPLIESMLPKKTELTNTEKTEQLVRELEQKLK
jgi:hypothetical protein